MEKLLHLFNTLWFERRLQLKTYETMALESVAENETVSDVDVGALKTLLISHVRSSSEQQLDVLNSDAESPKSVLGSKPKLETFVSGKKFTVEKVVVGKGLRCESLTVVNGFTDRKDTKPGLRKLGCGDGVCVKCGRKEKVALRVGIHGGGGGGAVDELEMKNQIKFWAQSVASAVR